MSKHNPTQRARDLKKANAALRGALHYEKRYSGSLEDSLYQVRRNWYNATHAHAKETSELRSQMRQLIAVMDKQEHESYLAGESWGQRVSHADAALIITTLTNAKLKVRNHRILSGALLVLAVAGWLV